jgi:hypothetical protein
MFGEEERCIQGFGEKKREGNSGVNGSIILK